MMRTGRQTQPSMCRQMMLVIYAYWIMLVTELELWLKPFYILRQNVAELQLSDWRDGMPTVAQIRDAIRTANRYLPHATCMVVALSCQVILKHYGHEACLHVGVHETQQHIIPHAWVESEGEIIVGDDGHLHKYRQLIPRPPDMSD